MKIINKIHEIHNTQKIIKSPNSGSHWEVITSTVQLFELASSAHALTYNFWERIERFDYEGSALIAWKLRTTKHLSIKLIYKLICRYSLCRFTRSFLNCGVIHVIYRFFNLLIKMKSTLIVVFVINSCAAITKYAQFFACFLFLSFKQ